MWLFSDDTENPISSKQGWSNMAIIFPSNNQIIETLVLTLNNLSVFQTPEMLSSYSAASS